MPAERAPEHVFLVSALFAREFCSNRAIDALYVGQGEVAEIYETMTRLVEEVSAELECQIKV